MLAIALWTVAALVITAFVAMVSVLCSPMLIRVMFDTHNRPALSFEMAPFWGLLPIVLTPEWRKRQSDEKRKEAVSPKPRQARYQDIAALVSRMLQSLPDLLSRIGRRVKLERFDANIRFGLSDPANTGIVYGVLIPVLQSVGVSGRPSIVLNPDFGNEVFDGSCQIAARLVPAALIAPVLGFAWEVMIWPRLSGASR